MGWTTTPRRDLTEGPRGPAPGGYQPRTRARRAEAKAEGRGPRGAARTAGGEADKGGRRARSEAGPLVGPSGAALAGARRGPRSRPVAPFLREPPGAHSEIVAGGHPAVPRPKGGPPPAQGRGAAPFAPDPGGAWRSRRVGLRGEGQSRAARPEGRAARRTGRVRPGGGGVRAASAASAWCSGSPRRAARPRAARRVGGLRRGPATGPRRRGGARRRRTGPRGGPGRRPGAPRRA